MESVETVEVDYDRDGIPDVMLPENDHESVLTMHLIYPYHHGVEFERAIMVWTAFKFLPTIPVKFKNKVT